MLVLGLGSNLGDRETHLKRAVNLLTRGPDAPLSEARLSGVWASQAWVPEGAPADWQKPFLNCAIAGETRMAPEELLRAVKRIERALGREPAERWAPRVIDIDILWWEGVRIFTPELEIPHPGLLERPFALAPMTELVPEATVKGRTVREHLDRLSGGGEAGSSARRASDGLRGASPVPGAAPAPESDFRIRWPRLMGILNVTPDSFSDGGRFISAGAARAQAERLLDGGAEILDVGAESTRPDGVPVSADQERARMEPVLRALLELRHERPFRLSLDSRNPETVAWALDSGIAGSAGIDMINDVTGFEEPAMVELAARSGVEAVCMHALSVPVVKGEFLPDDCDPVAWLLEWGRARLDELRRAGIPGHRTYFDPGIGFGKTIAQNRRILREIERFHDLGVPLLVGHSRKSFFRDVTDRPAHQRDDLTVDVSVELAHGGVEVLRVHDPAVHTRRFREAAWTSSTRVTVTP